MRADRWGCGCRYLAGLGLFLTGLISTGAAADNDIGATAVSPAALAALASGQGISARQSVSLGTTPAQVMVETEGNGAAMATRPLTMDIHDLTGINVIAINNGLNSRVSVSVQATLTFQTLR